MLIVVVLIEGYCSIRCQTFTSGKTAQLLPQDSFLKQYNEKNDHKLLLLHLYELQPSLL